MKRGRIIGFFVVCVGLLSLSVTSWAEPLEGQTISQEELIRQLKEMRDLIRQQGMQIEQLEEIIEQLSGRTAAGPAGPPAELTKEDVEKIVLNSILIEQEKEKKDIFSNGILSKKNEWLKIGGELEFEWFDMQGDKDAQRIETTTSATDNDGAGTLQVDKVTLNTDVMFSDDIKWTTVLEFSGNENNVFIDQSYLTWNNFFDHLGFDDPTDTWLRVGRAKVIDVGKRSTESYSLIAHAFNREEVNLVQGGGKLNLRKKGETGINPYWKVQMTNGGHFSDRGPGDRSGPFEMIAERRSNADDNSNKWVAWGTGFDMDLGGLGEHDVFYYRYHGNISEADRTFLRGITGWDATFGINADDSQYDRWGVNWTWKCGKYFKVLSQYTDATIGPLGRIAYNVEPSVKIPLDGVNYKGRDFFKQVELVYRWGRLQEIGIPSVKTDARTWDRWKSDVGVIAAVTKNINLKLEYSWQGENSGNLFGADDVDNNEFIAQMELKF